MREARGGARHVHERDVKGLFARAFRAQLAKVRIILMIAEITSGRTGWERAVTMLFQGLNG